ncbi:MAG TPA: DNA repair protein RadA [Dermatophilaceae bacterium]|nr:DNA repair protein RadA [Dermatophilaceae bacterium]
MSIARTRAAGLAGKAAAGTGPGPGFHCQECGWSAVKWVGRCGGCRCWGSLVERPPAAARPVVASLDGPAALPIGQIDTGAADARPSGVGELDRVLGGGLVPGAVALVAGEPGIGKSTLLLDVAACSARSGLRVLYVAAEESAAQVRLRAERIGAMTAGLFLVSETDLARVIGQARLLRPDLLVVDSVQTVSSAALDGAAGNIAQVRHVAAHLIAEAKDHDMTTLLVGHVTKDGSVAGPRTLEHLVDVVVHFEGDRHGRLRLVRAVKNRYGPTDEVGCFEVGEAGLVGLTDPSALFLSSRDAAVPGTCVTVTLEGRRPLVAEVQTLLTRTTCPAPRRTTSGIDSARVAMLLAVLDRHLRLPVRDLDCYVSSVGGVRIGEPTADLAIALALASSVQDAPLSTGLVAFGEVGLAGELRPVTGLQRRLTEAARLGFATAVVPTGSHQPGTDPPSLRVVAVPDLLSALGAATQPLAGYSTTCHADR